MDFSFKYYINKIINGGDAVLQLIAINIIFFLLIQIPIVFIQMFLPESNMPNIIFNNVAMPAYLPTLAHKFWTIITASIFHNGIWHLAGNLLWLFIFGNILQDFIGHKKIIPLFIFGALSGSLFFILSYNFIPLLIPQLQSASIVGASAGVMAIVIGAATIAPDYPLYLIRDFFIRLKFVAIIVLLIDLLSVPASNAGGHIAHLGGGLIGFIFIKQLQNGKDWSKIFNTMFSFFSNLFAPKPKLKILKNDKQKNTSNYSKPTGAGINQAEQQKKIDAILDKISASGYDNLSQEEKDFLFKISNQK